MAETHPVVVLRSDEIRPPGAGYGPEAVAANYRELIGRAAELVALGESVVLDASWSSGAMRALAREMAVSTSTDVVEILCEAPAELAAERIRARGRRGIDPSEATPEVAAAMASRFDPWPNATVIRTDRSLAESVAGVDLSGSRPSGTSSAPGNGG
jgi:predicted kinase